MLRRRHDLPLGATGDFRQGSGTARLGQLGRRGSKTEESLEDIQESERPESLATSVQLLIESGIKDRHTALMYFICGT